MLNIKGKNVLVIMPYYFGYDAVIKNGIERLGANVNIIYENMDEVSPIYRFVYVYLKKYKTHLMDNYYKKLISRIINKIDIVLVIRGASLSENSIEFIKSRFPNAKYVFYHWDSVENNPCVVELMNRFDHVLTFDPDDAEKFHWDYRPLFYTPNIKKEDKSIDILFICSLHSNRMKVLKQLKAICEDKHIVLKDYLYSKPIHYIKQKYIVRNEEFLTDDVRVRFRPLLLSDTNDLYSKSRIIVDYTHPQQNGFTMRTIESIGYRCKLITNNKKIVISDFYDERNIILYDEDEIVLPDEFIKNEYKELDNDIYYRYSLDGWLEEVLGKK